MFCNGRRLCAVLRWKMYTRITAYRHLPWSRQAESCNIKTSFWICDSTVALLDRKTKVLLAKPWPIVVTVYYYSFALGRKLCSWCNLLSLCSLELSLWDRRILTAVVPKTFSISLIQNCACQGHLQNSFCRNLSLLYIVLDLYDELSRWVLIFVFTYRNESSHRATKGSRVVCKI